jgi:hypothetical protein
MGRLARDAVEDPPMSFQLCLRCGRHEVTGSYCTFCRTAEYDVADHEHAKDIGSHGCPLGSYLDPLNGDPGHRRQLLADRRPLPEGLPIRHHPRATGYSAETDPPVPSWVSPAHRQTPIRAVPEPRDGRSPLWPVAAA